MADANSPDKPPSTEAKEVPLEFVGKGPAAEGEGKAGSKASGRVEMSHTMRFALSVLVGVAADAVEIPLEGIPPAVILIDLLTAGAFFFIWGFRWEIALVLIPELIPGLNVFPTWFLLALYLGQQGQPTRPQYIPQNTPQNSPQKPAN